jgi:V/A-type H+-transporting ATPase subunit A
VLEVSRMMREGFLQQSAMSEVDASCPLAKQLGMLSLFLEYYGRAQEALDREIKLERLLEIPEREELSRMREIPEGRFGEDSAALKARLGERFDALLEEAKR